jgi:hypothetical protein
LRVAAKVVIDTEQVEHLGAGVCQRARTQYTYASSGTYPGNRMEKFLAQQLAKQKGVSKEGVS